MLRLSAYLICTLAVAGFLGCDKVNDPIQPMAEVESKRQILVEDYTGHQCGNCPGAAEIIENLSRQYGAKVIPVAVHAGFFSRTSLKYPTSYTTTAGVEWDKQFMGNAGYPNGMVNRTKSGSSYVKSPSSWASEVALQLKKTHYLDLRLAVTYNAESRNLNTTVHAKFAKSYPAPLKVSVILVEDSIVGPQLDYRLEDDYVTDYVFNHMLRAEINGTWGTSLTSAAGKYNDSLSVSFPDFEIRQNFNDKRLSVVAFAFDETTLEVLQAAKMKIR